jgi:hypothetical protein
MDGFCKLHAKIINSSIWNAPDHCRLLWITMLASADAYGNVEGSVGGLAHMARISYEHAKEALEMLAGPDPDSGDETTGERIRKIAPGIWHIINHGRYRERQTRRQALQAQASKNYRARKTDDASSESSDSVYAFKSSVSVPQSSVPEKKKENAPKTEETCELFQDFWEAYPRKIAKAAAGKAWVKLTTATRALAIVGAKRFAPMVTKPDFIPYPASWLNSGGWDDNPGDMACCASDSKAAMPTGNRGHMPHNGFAQKDYSDTGMDD